MKSADGPDGLSGIESRLTALLALGIEARQRELGVRGKPRPIDVLLADAGMTSKEIGKLLGKTDRAVNLVLQGHRAERRSAGNPQ